MIVIPRPMRPAALTAALLALAGAAWTSSEGMMSLAGLGILDIPGRVVLVFLVLTAADGVISRLLPDHPPHA